MTLDRLSNWRKTERLGGLSENFFRLRIIHIDGPIPLA